MTDARKSPRLSADQAARFRRLAVPHLDVLLRTALYLTNRDQAAEDLVQDTMIKAMRAIDRFQDGTDIKAWLLTILRRAHIDTVRGNKHATRVVSVEQSAIDLPDPTENKAGENDGNWNDPAALMERFGDNEVITALKDLPEEIRWTLLLVDVEQMDHAAAATILEIPVGTVKSRAHRGRAMLRDRLYAWAQQRGWVSRQESSHARQSKA